MRTARGSRWDLSERVSFEGRYGCLLVFMCSRVTEFAVPGSHRSGEHDGDHPYNAPPHITSRKGLHKARARRRSSSFPQGLFRFLPVVTIPRSRPVPPDPSPPAGHTPRCAPPPFPLPSLLPPRRLSLRLLRRRIRPVPSGLTSQTLQLVPTLLDASYRRPLCMYVSCAIVRPMR